MNDTFSVWITELQALDTADGCPDYIDQTGEDAWIEGYFGGQSPAEAWADEKAYAAQDAG